MGRHHSCVSKQHVILQAVDVEKKSQNCQKPLLQKDLQHCTMYANIHLGIICTKINDYK